MALGLVASLGLAAAEVATYWDDSWHTDRGRDEFAIPPHLLLYGGVLAASLVIAAWAVLAWRGAGGGLGGIHTALRDPAIRLAGIGGAATLASAPLDNWWHVTFGRDAVLWSPPHLTAVAGTFALVVGLSAGLRETTGHGADTARLFAGAGIIGALQVLVLEYDSGVPQFSTLWFLPVAATALCLAAALLDDLLPGRWKPTQAALTYTILRAVTVALLALLGFSLTVVPPVLPLLLLLGLAARVCLGVRLVLIGGLAPLVWWPVLELQSSVTTTVPGQQLPVAVVLGALAGAVVALIHGDLRSAGRFYSSTVRVGIVVGVLALTFVNSPGRAWAHDPGQGPEVESVHMTVSRHFGVATVWVAIPSGCGSLEADGIIARRAGQTVAGNLRLSSAADGDCVATGTVAGLSDGRWFVYAQMKNAAGDELEAWLPVENDSSESADRPLYEPPSASDSSAAQVGVGGILLLVIAAILILTLRLSRHVPTASEAGSSLLDRRGPSPH